MNILIVEDVEVSKLIFTKYLKEHNCKFCESEKTLYENLSNHKFDLIIMDIGLPGSKNGIQLTKELKNSKAYSSIPIICATVHQFNKEAALEAGADNFILKPLTKQDLLSAVEKFMTISKSGD